MSNDLAYRINTNVGENNNSFSLDFQMSQTYDTLDILSLKLKQKNIYNFNSSDKGVIVGRVLAGSKEFGIPNAKISIFIPYDSNDGIDGDIFYAYDSVVSIDENGVRYNLLPNEVDELCHQDVGTLFNKTYLLDNKDTITIFDKYYKFTTSTNNAGDYMIYGVPVGEQTLHVDVDLSDIGILSQTPRDMINKGYNIEQFESPTKFKKSTDLNQLSQIYTQDKGLYVYSFWGDTTSDDTNASITRYDIRINYEFEPTCVFMGSIVTDRKENSFSQKCTPSREAGKMSELITGEGKIEMIRKTPDDKVQEFNIKGGKLINGDGVWCYQIPMNLDFIRMDEYGNIIPTNDPSKGIPTRARVRFRITLDEDLNDNNPNKRASFLVPNNPRIDSKRYPTFTKDDKHIPDYEFGTFTRDEDFCDLFMNKVYTVKSYIPRLQKYLKTSRDKNIGIKEVNRYGENNPIPYNNLDIEFNFVYRFICTLATIFINVVYFLNKVILSPIYNVLMTLSIECNGWRGIFKKGPIAWIGDKLAGFFARMAEPFKCISVDGLCDDGNSYYPGCHGKALKEANGTQNSSDSDNTVVTTIDALLNCVENNLAEENEIISFNFNNDWINGMLYAPTWYRKIKLKRRVFFGIFPAKAKDKWCSSERETNIKLYENCALKRKIVKNNNDGGHHIEPLPDSNDVKYIDSMMVSGRSEDNCYGFKCHKRSFGVVRVNNGLIKRKMTKAGVNIFYYRPVEYDSDGLNRVTPYNVYDNKVKNGFVKTSKVSPISFNDNKDYLKLLFATDIVLLGSLNKNDEDGTPQFFKNLPSTTYQLPENLLVENSTPEKSNNYNLQFNEKNDNVREGKHFLNTDATGSDWGNHGYDQNYGDEYFKHTNKGRLIHRFNTNILDDGGLFYGLNCNFSYVKPKSCINLKRICEYGIDLDRTIEISEIDINNKQIKDDKLLIADGYISYDEQINIDERSMFATMNSNYLKVKENPNTGYPVYDYDYLYIDNFDGSLRNLMQKRHGDNGVGGDYNTDWGRIHGENRLPNYVNNYLLENINSDYLRFRYGTNIYYYSPKEHFDIFYDQKSKSKTTFENMIPRYENSYYFYFGLKPGKTAIDRFKTLYYSECFTDENEKPTININAYGNSWCTNSKTVPDPKTGEDIELNDGAITVEVKGIIMPYSLTIYPNGIGATDECFISNINNDKVYIGIDENMDAKTNSLIYGYKKVLASSANNHNVKIESLNNGDYLFVFKDANNNEYEQEVSFRSDYLNFNVETESFKYSNEDLQTLFDTYDEISNQLYDGDNPRKREIGGYITINNITHNGLPMGGASQESFMIFVEPERKSDFRDLGMGNYVGTCFVPFEVFENTDVSFLNTVPYPYCGNNTDVNGILYVKPFYNVPIGNNNSQFTILEDLSRNIVIGVPKGDVRYKVTVTQLCQKNKCICDNQTEYTSWIDSLTENSVTKTVFVDTPISSKLIINDINYSFIKNYDSGYKIFTNEIDKDKAINILIPFKSLNFANDNENIITSWFKKYNITNPHLDKFHCEYDSSFEEVNNFIEALKPYNTLYMIKNESMITSTMHERHKYLKYYDSNSLPKYKKYTTHYEDIISNDEIKDLCLFNWPISYCYNLDSFTEDEYNSKNSYEKKIIVDEINNILLKRLQLSFKFKASNSIINPNDGREVKVIVSPKPVATNPSSLIYYIDDSIDENNNRDFVSNINYQFTSENSTGKMYLPTLTIDNDKYTFFFKNNRIKYPYFVAGRYDNDTLFPSVMKEEYFLPDNGHFNNMFAFHTILRPSNYRISTWSFNKKLLTINKIKINGEYKYCYNNDKLQEFTLFSLILENYNENSERRIYYKDNNVEKFISLPLFKRLSIGDRSIVLENSLSYKLKRSVYLKLGNNAYEEISSEESENDKLLKEDEYGSYREISYSPYYVYENGKYKNISIKEKPNDISIIEISSLGYYDKVKNNHIPGADDRFFDNTLSSNSFNNNYFESLETNGNEESEKRYYKVMNGLSNFRNKKITNEEKGNGIISVKNSNFYDYRTNYGETSMLPIPFKNDKFILNDESGYTFSENIYGSMEIVIINNGKEYDESSNSYNFIEVGTLGVTSDNVKYYLVPITNDNEYPLFNIMEGWKVNTNDIEAITLNVNDNVNEFFNSYKDFSEIKNVKYTDDENGNKFTLLNENKFYIISETYNGCKCLSPLYIIDDVNGGADLNVTINNKNISFSISNPNVYIKESVFNNKNKDNYENYQFKSSLHLLLTDLDKKLEPKEVKINNVIFNYDTATKTYICNSFVNKNYSNGKEYFEVVPINLSEYIDSNYKYIMDQSIMIEDITGYKHCTKNEIIEIK